VVEGVGSSVSGLTFRDTAGAPAAVDMVDSVDWYSTLHVLAEVTTRLKKMVQDLKTLYVSCSLYRYTVFANIFAGECTRNNGIFERLGYCRKQLVSGVAMGWAG